MSRSPYRALGEGVSSSDDNASGSTFRNEDQRTPLLANHDALKKPAEAREGVATLASCVANLANTILGTGMLAMPHAFASGGLLPGILTVVLCASTAGLGLYFLTRAAAQAPHRAASFNALSKLTYPKIGWVFDLAVFCKCYGVSISYLIIIGALMPRVVKSFSPDAADWLLDRRLWILASMCILSPIAFFRKLDSLKFISYIALVSVANLLFVVVYKTIVPSGMPPRPPIHWVQLSTKYVSSLPVQIFAFTCAQNIFAVYNEVQSNTQARLNTVIGASIGSAACIYELLGILGYVAFGPRVGSNIIEMYPHSILVSICQLGIVVLVLFSYPLQLHPCRASLDKVIAHRSLTEDDDDTVADDHASEDIPLLRFVVETTAILLTTFLVSLFVERLEVVLGFVGATGSTTISFILPSMYFIKLFGQSESKSDRWLIRIARLLLVWGFLVMVICVSLNIYHLVNEPAAEASSLTVMKALGGNHTSLSADPLPALTDTGALLLSRWRN